VRQGGEAAVVAGLGADRDLLGRTSTAERVAALLRDRITDGSLPPATRLAEDSLGQALGVSRNTLREAFRLLARERLLVHELNRGVFVRKLTASDIADLYRVRRLVECAVVRESTGVDAERLEGLRAAVRDAEVAAGEDRWLDVGTANIRFHSALVALAGSARVDEVMRQVLAELRLAFAVMADPHAFHEPYLARNRRILELLETDRAAEAEAELSDYLADAARELLARVGDE
jgi:DNA-binding GntR family transcriptional regulator